MLSCVEQCSVELRWVGWCGVGWGGEGWGGLGRVEVGLGGVVRVEVCWAG